MANLNRLSLIGHAGSDATAKETSGGERLATFRLATAETWKDKNTGEKRTATEWHRVVAWGPLAGIVERYVKKGSRVFVEGPMRYREYAGGDGVKRYSAEVNAQTVQLLDRAPAATDDEQTPPTP
jgi:single-strand DNA-binding protein